MMSETQKHGKISLNQYRFRILIPSYILSAQSEIPFCPCLTSAKRRKGYMYDSRDV